MPPRARAKPTHQQTPWASGRRKPPPKKQPWAKRAKKGLGKALRKHPLLGLVLQIAFAALAVVLLVTGLLLENVLFFLATALSGLGALATRRAVVLEQERQRRSGPKVHMPPPGSRPRKTRPEPGGAAPPAPGSGPVTCTETGRPIEGDNKCDCASRHVATEEGARRYGRPVGAPLGRKGKQHKTGDTVKTGG